MRLVATEYMSLDGIFEEPGGWSGPFFNDETRQFKWAELQASDALLLGRNTYAGFSAAWPKMTGRASRSPQRGVAASVAITTARGNPDRLLELSRAADTLVVLMARADLAETAGVLARALGGSRTAALISNDAA